MLIIGIDPGLNYTGYGLIEVFATHRLECRAAGVIHPDSKELAARLQFIFQQVDSLLEEFHPAAMAMEDLYATYEHPKTAILMGHARGVIYLAAARRGIPVTNYIPTVAKRAVTGHGRASKSQVQSMVQRLLRLPELPEPDHISDALSLAICHAYRERLPQLVRP